MLKKMVEVIAVALIVAGVAGAYFRLMGSLPISVTQTQKNSTFDVTGEGKEVVVPDQAMISLGIVEEGPNLKEVQERVNQVMQKLAQSLKAMGIDEKDIKTTSYNVSPYYRQENKYRIESRVQVVVKDMDKVSPAFDLVGTLGLDNVNGPNFGLSDELLEKTMKKARAAAVSEAKKKAEELAGLAGVNLGRVVNVQEGYNPYGRSYVMEDVGVVSSTKAPSTPTSVEPGSSEVVVNVTLSYETR